MAIYSRRKRF